MKQILTILLLLPLCVFAQSHESKQLYKQGLKLYVAEKYEEALTYFQKSDSLDKAILSRRTIIIIGRSSQWRIAMKKLQAKPTTKGITMKH